MIYSHSSNHPISHSNNHATYFQQPQSQQSSCSQCKRNTYGIKEQEQESSEMYANNQSNSSEDIAVVPLRNHITQHSYQIQRTLKILQFQVDSLKRQNQSKDKIIHQLKFHVQRTAKQDLLKSQMDKQAFQINRLRQQLGCSPRNQFQMSGKMFTSNSKSYDQKNQQRQHYSTHLYRNNNQLNFRNGDFLGQNYTSTTPKQYSGVLSAKNIQNYDLKITILQKQIREYQLQLIQTKQKLSIVEQQNIWQHKFILSFIKMCDQLSLNYGQKLKLNKIGQDMKKKTKVCWQYMKDLIGYFINNSTILNQSKEN